MKHHDTNTPYSVIKQTLRLTYDNTLTKFSEFLLALTAGMTVANIYFAHTLLDSIADEFLISKATIGIVITISQVFYALGLLLLVPLGDILNIRSVILYQILLLVIALTVVSFATNSIVFFIGIGAVGLLATVTQTLVAYAALLTRPSERGRIIGLVTSGIVIGILLARTFAGIMNDLAGWRSVYLSSAAILLLLISLLLKKLPTKLYEKSTLSYPQLVFSVVLLLVREKILIIRGLLAFLIFISFSTFWTAFVYPLVSPPHSFSHMIVGLFGLIGVFGALGANWSGNLADKGFGQLTTFIALLLLLSSWFFISFIDSSIFLLVIGIILFDFAIQAIHVTNQSLTLKINTAARSRLTAAYMIFYSVGSATGSIISTNIYTYYGWKGICIFGFTISFLAIIFWLTTYNTTKKLIK
ncbi:transporter [Brochothrix thermosphacta]|uniref:MFS transporter n=1 Tax=Brochothrix thermosphacta TaxID=2756 RepID=UPI00083F8D17|nr:MFS transporter [Brochothrix thermosphacta]ANZ98361.1 transporter [Brochothrix thermosphacta]ODJ51606.1 transporter [Brochothrix thermosphacta]SOC19502.1 putative uncharacterized transporter YgaY [Brochothrix thermosphacta]SPP29641.1 putative uncharacterized transporter YgaY [Brochothrix thermosphacta]